MSPVSENIKRMRIKRKLTQEELADKLLVTDDIVTNWESGVSQPDIDMLINIAESLNVDISVLIDKYNSPEARTKAIRQLIVALGIALILGISAYFLTPIAAKMRAQYYNIGPSFILQLYLLPIFWLFLGWGLMQGLGMLGVARPARSKISKPLHITVLILVLLYAVLMLPFLIESIHNMILSFNYSQNPSLYPNGFQFSYNIPLFLSNIEWKIMNVLYHQSAVFILPGIIYWLSKPMKLKVKT